MATFDASGLTFEQIDSLNDKELEDFFGTVKQQPPKSRLLNLQRCFYSDRQACKTDRRYSSYAWEPYKKEFPEAAHRSKTYRPVICGLCRRS